MKTLFDKIGNLWKTGKNGKPIIIMVAIFLIICLCCVGTLAWDSILPKPTPTPTFTLTSTSSPTLTATITLTSTLTITPTIIFTPTPTNTPTPTSTPTFTPTITRTPRPYIAPTVTSGAPCSCTGDLYNCSDFAYQSQAQACFNYCKTQGVGDIHRLDNDNDGNACESLP